MINSILWIFCIILYILCILTSKFHIKNPQSIIWQYDRYNIEFLVHSTCFHERLKHRTIKFVRFVIFQRTDRFARNGNPLEYIYYNTSSRFAPARLRALPILHPKNELEPYSAKHCYIQTLDIIIVDSFDTLKGTVPFFLCREACSWKIGQFAGVVRPLLLLLLFFYIKKKKKKIKEELERMKEMLSSYYGGRKKRGTAGHTR